MTLKRAISEARWIAKKGTKDLLVVDLIYPIPSDWEYFPNTKDFWRFKPNYESDNSTCCEYIPEIDSEFIPHVHYENDETVIMTRGCAMVYTPNWYKLVEEGEKIELKRGVPHIFDFSIKYQTHPELNVKFDIIWTPKMFKWAARMV